jgi:L-malate glycosyltransferase
MPNKTILHLTGAVSTKYGGLEKFLLELSKVCNTKGYNTILQYEIVPKSKEYLDDLEKNNIKIIVKPINTNPIGSILTITRLMKVISPEIVQTHFMNGVALLICPILTKIVHGQKIFHMQHLLSGLRRIPCIKFFLNRYNKIFCVSHAVADDLIHAGVNPNHISINYIGVFGNYEKSKNQRVFFRKKYNIPNEAIVLACIAFDHPVKGVDVLLNAFQRIIAEYPETHLVIVGIDPQVSTLYNLSNKLKVSSHVHWVGIIDHANENLSIADGYIQPSRKEGLGLGIIEAMAFGLPIVATNTGGIPEAVIDGETGYHADPGDPNSLADAIKQLLSEKERFKKLGENGFRRYQQMFKGENSIKNVLENYSLK